MRSAMTMRLASVPPSPRSGVGLDQLGDPACLCGCEGPDLETRRRHGAEESRFCSPAELLADQVGGLGDHQRRGYERTGVLERLGAGVVIGVGVVGAASSTLVSTTSNC
jgi:hypothetical protein